jgi:hypothetical protein
LTDDEDQPTLFGYGLLARPRARAVRDKKSIVVAPVKGKSINLAGFGIITFFRKRRPSFRSFSIPLLEIHHG